MDNKERSFEMATRLKALREENGLSFRDLSKALSEEGITVSKDSLMNYEISEEHRSRSQDFPNLKMKSETLLALASLYGVSTDYLLCLSDAKTNNEEVASVAEYLGITAKAAESLMTANKMGADDAPFDFNVHVYSTEGLSRLFESHHFLSAALLIEKAMSAHFVSQRRNAPSPAISKDKLKQLAGSFSDKQKKDYIERIELSANAEGLALPLLISQKQRNSISTQQVKNLFAQLKT